MQDIENQLLMNLYDYFTFNKIKMTSLIFDGIVCLPRQRIDINDIQNYILKKSGIPMKICIKALKEFHPRFGESNVNLKRYNEIYKCKTYINHKVIHHLHYKKQNNIAGYVCNNCNLKIKSKKELVVLFHNSRGYDNVYLLDTFSKIPNINISVIG